MNTETTRRIDDAFTFPKKQSTLTDPHAALTDFQKPPQVFSDSGKSGRTTSNSSISSFATVSSMSSIESSSTAMFDKPQLSKMQLTRAKSSTLSHSYSTSAFDLSKRTSVMTTETNETTDILMKKLLDSINDSDMSLEVLDGNGQDDLDKFCIPSPIAERALVDEGAAGFNKRDLGSPLQKRSIRSKVRRTHSMFYSKKEITETTKTFAPEREVGLNDTKDEQKESLLVKSQIEVFYTKNDLIPRINVDTLCKILDGHYEEIYQNITIVDCRFEYEYKGGHISGAVNASSQQELEDKFLCNRESEPPSSRLIVFHCEFSSYRGPLMASHLRTCDRNMNQDNYPHLDYPDILVLEGGYKSFFDRQPSRCFPQKYVEMNDDNHKNACEKELTRFRRDLKRASSFNSLSYTASLSQQAIVSSSPANSNSRGIHKRNVTSSGVIFNRRSSLKSNVLDISRKSLKSIDPIANDENKPPAALDFGFKFPLKDTLRSPSEKMRDLGLQPSGVKNKLSRSLTTVNM